MDIYFIFTNESLQNILDKSKNTITKIKKELQEVGLLEQIRTGFNKPNKLYLHDIETNISVEKNIQNSSELHDNKESQILDPNDTDYTNTENNDTDDMNDKKLTYHNNQTHHSNHYNSNFNDEALKFQLLDELPQSIQSYLNNFSITEIKIIKSVLLKAKKSFNNDYDTIYRLEDIEFEIVSVLKRFKAMLIQKMKTLRQCKGT